ncbi:unnamed protein product [Tuber aestivum]|uniref:Uncharacterized protein n=1 Tax=Tuber aestivum TaxID=59557 RepID=A0A292PRT5_9PEZI|nr:unnamed protein product [Tuber aestivum]
MSSSVPHLHPRNAESGHATGSRKKRSKERPNKRKNSRKKAPPSQPNPSEAGPSTAASSSVQENFAPSAIGARLEHRSPDDHPGIAQEGNYVLSTPQDSRPRILAPQALPVLPRTLVDGIWYIHTPNSLPEPFHQGYLTWANAERGASLGLTPRHPGAARWNNRTLRFWRLATDFNRFSDDEPETCTNSTRAAIDARNESFSAGDQRASPEPTFSHPIPQRPYTAPPHYRDYIP